MDTDLFSAFRPQPEPDMPIGVDEAEPSMKALTTAQRLMWLNADRVLYVGLFGESSVRNMGAFSIYISLNRPHRICMDGGAWEDTALSVVAPYARHRIISGERLLCNLMIEPESVEIEGLPRFLRDARGAVCAPQALRTMRDALKRSMRCGIGQHPSTEHFDGSFFGSALPERHVDRRIRGVLDKIKQDPNSQTSAEASARMSCLSVSRFLHLFRAEVGMPFRSFRTWQRARSVLYHVTQSTSLANIALDAGYPDSTHFSHSVRRAFGVTPKSLFASCRRLAPHASGAPASPRGEYV